MIPPGWWMTRRNRFQHRLARVLMVCPFGLFAAGASAASDSLAVDPLPAASTASLQDHVSRPHMLADPDWFNWGCSVIRGDDGAYHMFYARWPKALTFTAWLPHSEIVHAVADQPEGPYRMLELAMPSHGPGRGEWFTAHNPKIKRFEGRYDLDTEDCSMWYDATSHRFFAVFHAHTYIGWMSSPNGYDWERMPEPLTPQTLRFTDGSHDDPQRMERPFVLTDEQGLPRMLFVACRRGNTTLNVALPLRIHNQH